MSSTSAINPKGPSVSEAGKGATAWADTYLNTTVGQKVLVALTGSGLVGFVLFHMIGNLKLFSGPESINAYANFLKHDLGALIWIARAGLLGIFALHLTLALRLKYQTNAARPIGYYYQRSAQANPASKTMLQTGLVIGAFVVFHLAHYTFALVHDVTALDGSTVNYLTLKDAKGHHDVYSMLIAGFSTWWISAIYLVANVLLFVHLSHGIPSVFQTLGLVNRRFTQVVKMIGYGIAGTVLIGNLAIVLAIWTGAVK